MIKHDLELLLFALENLDNSMETATGQLMLQDMRSDINRALRPLQTARQRERSEQFGKRSIVRDMERESRDDRARMSSTIQDNIDAKR